MTLNFRTVKLEYVVVNENTLGIIREGYPNTLEVLAGSVIRGGYNPMNGPIGITKNDNIRPATYEDFDTFRLCPKGHMAFYYIHTATGKKVSAQYEMSDWFITDEEGKFYRMSDSDFVKSHVIDSEREGQRIEKWKSPLKY